MSAKSMTNASQRVWMAFCVLLSTSAILIIAGSARSDGGGTLTIRFSGLAETRGELIVTVADSREVFESEEQAFRVAEVRVEGAVASAEFEGLAAGEYAVKVFHDANSNRKLDMGLMGPKEKYGFSNNVMGFMGPPDYDAAKFAFDGSALKVDIQAR